MTNLYNVISIDKIEPPKGSSGNNWYRYIVGRNNTSMDKKSAITGNRRGTMKQVSLYAEDFANSLNFRSGKNGHSLWSPRQKKV